MFLLKQSTAVDVAVGPFVDAEDGVTAETGLTITQPDIRLSKNGAAFAQKSAAQTASHMENGYYSVNLSTTDTGTLGRLRLHVNESGALPVWIDFMVLPANVYDSLVAGSDSLQVDTTQIEGADATDQIRDAVVDDATRIDASALNTLAGHDPGETIMGATDLGTGSGLTALAMAAELAKVPKSDASVSWNATALADINAQADLALSDYDPPTKAEFDSGLAGLENLSAAEAEAAAAAALADYDPPTHAELVSEINSVQSDIEGLNDVSAAEVNAEVDTALADYDGPTKAEMDAAFAALADATRRGTAQAGGASTITLDSGASATNDAYNGAVIVLLEGTGTDVPVVERTRKITDYVGDTRIATVDEAWATQPDSDTVFLIIGAA